jgi:hypothetical protein
MMFQAGRYFRLQQESGLMRLVEMSKMAGSALRLPQGATTTIVKTVKRAAIMVA